MESATGGVTDIHTCLMRSGYGLDKFPPTLLRHNVPTERAHQANSSMPDGISPEMMARVVEGVWAIYLVIAVPRMESVPLSSHPEDTITR
jgi:hypothetical protein